MDVDGDLTILSDGYKWYIPLVMTKSSLWKITISKRIE